MKRCPKCQLNKQASEFLIHKTKMGEKVPAGYCVPCRAFSRLESRIRARSGELSPQKLKIRARQIERAQGFKDCPVCRQRKAVLEFSKNSASPDGFCYECKSCVAVRKRQEEKENPEARRNRFRKFLYGLTPEQFSSMRESQGDACACCREIFIKTPNVDHCHESGAIRGLLCRNCNVGIGNLQDSIERLEMAIVYLRRFKT